MGGKKRKKKRVPKSSTDVNVNIAPQKTPRLGANPDQVKDERPLWRFRRFDVDGQWGRQGIELNHLFDEILTKMTHYESMTWGHIKSDHRRNHFVRKTRLVKEAQQRLDELRITEERLFRFRLSGLERVWGIVDGAVFYLLWWDPNHEVCPSHKKHT